ncbi:kinase-like protein [Coniophora puteana RWD-64-598 SS2]|uniref:Kinase-like protein n=1 Tax=Coniophora puteana (strain RWD-64-598) TaxID=741705 RepID=A0A5M3MLY3_CONPW|nr:kinase-like protein [Coniophora puteana RWD-64-598 SS2]EIW80037.1 kinase-like protein [Coniophora puteana RWD-64-598 SS2]
MAPAHMPTIKPFMSRIGIIVVDFEYSAVNPLAFDIANHFHEWTANYHSDVPHILDPSRYPTLEQRRNFYVGYLQHAASSLSDVAGESPSPASEKDLATLERQVRIWSAASHGMWAIWGIVQARDDLARGETQPEFDYIGYAQCRMQSFRREVEALGI